jgi:hypothetical protein
MASENVLIRFIYIALFLMVSGQVISEEIKGIYSAEVNVFQSRGFNKRSVFASGLEQIILKLTGINKALSNPQFKGLKDISNRLIQKYDSRILTSAQRRQWRADYRLLYAKNPRRTPYSKVIVSYAEKPITNFFKRNKIPYWSNLRPLSLFWVKVKKSTVAAEPIILDRYTNHKIKNKIAKISRKVGLPLIYPHLDAIDKQYVSLQMLKDYDIDADSVKLASERYSAFNVVIVDVNKINNTYFISWTARIEQKTYVWDTESVDLYQALQRGILQNVHYILQMLNEGIEFDSQRLLKIKVSNIQNYEAMSKIKKYLNALPKLEGLVIKKVDSTSIQFEAYLKGTLLNLKRYIRLKQIVSIEEVKPKDDLLLLPDDVVKENKNTTPDLLLTYQ